MTLKLLLGLTAVTAASLAYPATAISQVKVGAASFAAAPPFYKAKTSPGGPGFNATAMLTREIFADEPEPVRLGDLDVPGRPLPTNDWWTDLLNSRYSGALWSYPAMLHMSEEGVCVNYPSYWADAGKELKSRSSITVGGVSFRAAAAIAADWHDWDVRFRLPSSSASSGAEISVTSMQGSPFTWFEFTEVAPQLQCSAVPELFDIGDTFAGVRIGDDLYGLYYPVGSRLQSAGRSVIFPAATGWLTVALLRSETDLRLFAPYATSIPRSTIVEWNYDETNARITNKWTVNAENLREGADSAPVLQGFLPHAYKYTLADASLTFIDNGGFMTPRGTLRLSASTDGTFSYACRFSGMLPTYAPPLPSDSDLPGTFRPEVLRKLMTDYAAGGSFGADTYWGGKGLLQMALNMSFAKESGETAVYEESRRRLREALCDWLTYTPGEDSHFFSYYPRWGAMLGFDVSYDSDAFNDHHFHYGYFTYAAALLCMEDGDFARDYGELLTMIAKDYANWDRNDRRFPFMRTFAPWNGHSWAGGLGDPGNDNGNGQESTSEAMQSWGGLYLLGIALDNREMRDAGIWGWSTEARATREYWYDIDAPRPANAGGRKIWPGKGDRKGNYDYTQYPYAYNSNITGKGIGWWTWFGGDPLFMHGIQWMPVSPALDYLSWDTDFTAWAFDDMMRGANSAYSHDWFNATSNTENGDRIEPLADNDWGNVALTYLERSDPGKAALIFDEALERGSHIATAVSTGHISYYVIHSHLSYGDPDFSVYADIPTARLQRQADGTPTYIVYNPSESDRTVNFFSENGTVIKRVTAPARRLAAISADPTPSDVEFISSEGLIIPPGASSQLSWRTLDQYGAGMTDHTAVATLSPGAPAVLSESARLAVSDSAEKGSRFTLTLTDGEAVRVMEFIVNDPPQADLVSIEGLPDIIEKGMAVQPVLKAVDQYGCDKDVNDVSWSAESIDDGTVYTSDSQLVFPSAGRFRVSALSASSGASAVKEVFVTPPLPLVSLGANVIASSAENVGTLPAGACDGDSGSRWGSSHSDDEWLVVDLGENCLISRAEILWEAAFASLYELQTAPDGCTLKDIDVSYAGTTYKVSVPAEDQWTTVATEQASGPGVKATNLSANGRYVRMKGLARGTGYGYSLYEMSIYGLRSSLSDDAAIGVDFSLPEMTDCGTTIPLTARIFTKAGTVRDDIPVTWSSDRGAEFGKASFTPLEPGFHTVTARCGDTSASQARIFVNDIERMASVSLASSYVKVAAGMTASIPYKVINQFMAPFSGDASQLEINVTDNAGHPATDAVYDPESMTFTTDVTGIYRIDFGNLASCTVDVMPLNEINLALGCPAEASSSNGGNRPSLAVDDDSDSRWESEWSEPHTLTVDLEGLYRLNRFAILWEGAFATSYRILTSADGMTWETVFSDDDCRGGYDSHSFSPVTARYVRLCLDRRALSAYGFSVREFEIYGLEYLSDLDQIIAGDPEVRWFNLQGQSVSRPSAPGIYIRICNGRSDKILIR